MNLLFAHKFVAFQDDDGNNAGKYIYSDRFKPYLHPLSTPNGHCLTLAKPHDHPHHKGVMFALSADDINFWEERQVRPGEAVGVQRHLGFGTITETGDRIGFEQSLLWTSETDDLPTFKELRTITCSDPGNGEAYRWTWSSILEALKDVRLIQSHWAHAAADGRSINYHGLGIRFRREFGSVFRGTHLFLDGVETDFSEGLGQRPHEIAFIGTLDGFDSPPKAGVRVRQMRTDALFATKDPFPLVCLGPTNAGPLDLKTGDTLRCDYELAVFDGPNLPAI
ncbi:MAG: PmoA family protein [Roseibium sp.]|nr:PmoA family protein [Roseibium sp.]